MLIAQQSPKTGLYRFSCDVAPEADYNRVSDSSTHTITNKCASSAVRDLHAPFTGTVASTIFHWHRRSSLQASRLKVHAERLVTASLSNVCRGHRPPFRRLYLRLLRCIARASTADETVKPRLPRKRTLLLQGSTGSTEKQGPILDQYDSVLIVLRICSTRRIRPRVQNCNKLS